MFFAGAHMEGITRLVDISMARHGYEFGVDHRHLQWSRWFRCDASFDFRLVPSAAGIYTFAEEIVPVGEVGTTGGKRMLAVLRIAETEDLCLALARHMAPKDPLSARLWSGRCFVRFAKVAEASHRRAACNALNQWLANSAGTASGFGAEFLPEPDPLPPPQPEQANHLTETKAPALPAGF
jgi:hypothetical protein